MQRINTKKNEKNNSLVVVSRSRWNRKPTVRARDTDARVAKPASARASAAKRRAVDTHREIAYSAMWACARVCVRQCDAAHTWDYFVIQYAYVGVRVSDRPCVCPTDRMSARACVPRPRAHLHPSIIELDRSNSRSMHGFDRSSMR